MFLAESASMCLAYVWPASLKEAGGSLKIQDRAVQETRDRRTSAKIFALRASISNRHLAIRNRRKSMKIHEGVSF